MSGREAEIAVKGFSDVSNAFPLHVKVSVCDNNGNRLAIAAVEPNIAPSCMANSIERVLLKGDHEIYSLVL